MPECRALNPARNTKGPVSEPAGPPAGDAASGKPTGADEETGRGGQQDGRRRRTGRILTVSALLAAALSATIIPAPAGEEATEVPVSTIVTLAEAGRITSAVVDENTYTITVETTAETGDEEGLEEAVGAPSGSLKASYPPAYTDTLVDRLVDAGVEVEAEPRPRPGVLAGLLTSIAPLLIILIVFALIMRRSPLSRLGRLGSGRGEPAETPEDRFGDVIGCEDAVEELKDIVDILTDPDRYLKMAARTPRGYLLAGPPGTGKTLLARAVAGEAGVPFYAVTGSEFVEVFAGQGAGRVRDLFARARKHPAAIVFIDEIDAVGRRRTPAGGSGGQIETENTLNQLLAEMDGFQQSRTIVIAATNRPDMLDQALTRAGRFDRTIPVPAPDRNARRELILHYLARHPHDDDIDADLLSRRTAGMTGADIANMTNRAAIAAARAGKENIGPDEIETALTTLTLGRERTGHAMTERDRTVTAWHEAGHAVCALVTDGAPKPVAASIIPRGPAGGATWLAGTDDLLTTREELQAQLVVALAGRAGEKAGLNGTYTTGAHDDLTVATDLARRMVENWGMTEGRLKVGRDEDDEAVELLLQQAAEQADMTLSRHRKLLTAVAEALLEEETLDAVRLRALAEANPAGRGRTRGGRSGSRKKGGKTEVKP